MGGWPQITGGTEIKTPSSVCCRPHHAMDLNTSSNVEHSNAFVFVNKPSRNP